MPSFVIYIHIFLCINIYNIFEKYIMLSIKDFLSLKNNDVILIGKYQYIAIGKNDLKEPQLYRIDTSESLSGAIYICHLMKYKGNLPELNFTEQQPDSINIIIKDDDVVNKSIRKKRIRKNKNE